MTDRDILIRTIIGEAANEGAEGWAAVAHVVRNRAMDGRWPNSLADVSMQNKQFSAWNKGAGGNDLVNKHSPGSPLYERVGAVVDKVLAGEVPDMTGGATHYYSPRGMDALVNEGSQSNRLPRWLQQENERRGGGTVTIGGHIFTGRAKGTPDSIVASANNGSGERDTQMGKRGNEETRSVDPAMAERLYELYTQGKMNPQQKADYEADVAAGAVPVPTGAQIAQPVNAQVINVTADQSQQIYDAFIQGRMTPQQEADYLADVQAGSMISPANAEQLNKFAQNRMTPMAFESMGMPAVTAPPTTPDNRRTEFDLTREFSSEAGGQLFMDAAGTGPSPTSQVTGGTPLTDIPLPMLGGLSVDRAGDTALAALGGLGAIGGGMAGLAGDAVEFATGNRGSARRLTKDLAAMPEAFAGTPQAMIGATRPAINAARQAPETPTQRPALDVPADHTRPITQPQTQTVTEADQAELQPLIARAAKNNTAAREELAARANVDPEAMASADRLDVDVPGDVFAQDAAVRQATGLVRAVRGSDASAEWEETFTGAQRRAYEIIEDQGGSPDLAATADRVQESLTTSIDTLRADGSAIFDDIAKQVSADVRMQPPTAKAYLDRRVEALGGEDGLRGPLRDLYRQMNNGDGMTYERLRQERAQIGRAAFKGDGPYADADTATLREVYHALGEDQTNFIRAEVGDDAADRLVQGNGLWTQAKELEDGLVAGFGKDQQGSIANTLRSAITNAARGDNGRINRVLDVVPEDLQRETLLTAISEVSRVQSGQGGFSFASYAKTYRGLRENGPAYGRISGILGDDTSNVMRDLYELSVHMDRASNNVPRTGQSNQGLLFAESKMSAFMNGPVGRNVRGVAAGTVATAAAGPLAGGVAAVAGSTGRVGRDTQRAFGNMVTDPRFKRMMTEAAKDGSVSDRSINAVRTSPAYRRWARVSGIDDADAWILDTMLRGQALQDERSGVQ